VSPGTTGPTVSCVTAL